MKHAMLMSALLPMLLALPDAIPRASAQNFAAAGASSEFRVEWESVRARNGRPLLRGYLYNVHTMRAENVQLKVERLDADARTVATQFAMVTGTIAPGARAYFEVPVAAADASYRVSIQSFDRSGCGSG
jgi:hypothetical protein